MSDSLYIFKIIIAGDSGVGKTTLVRRYVDGVFTTSKKATIGIDYFLKHIKVKSELSESPIALQIWDLAGEEKYRTFLPAYIPGTHGLILVFSDDIKESFHYLSDFLKVLRELVKEKIPLVLIKAKNDLEGESESDSNAISDFMKENEITHYLDTSSKTGENVKEAFKIIANLIAKEKGLV